MSASVAERTTRLIAARVDDHTRELVHGASIAFGLKVASAAVSVVFNLVLARMLGPDGAGLYFLALTVLTIAAIVGRLGLDDSLLRFTAATNAVQDWPGLKGVRRRAMGLALGGTTVVTLALLLASEWMATAMFHKPALTTPLRIMILAIIPTAFVALQGEFLKGLKRIFDSQLLQGLLVPVFSNVFLVWLARANGVNGAVASYVLATVASAVFGVFLLRRATPRLKHVAGHFPLRLLLSSSVPSYGVATMNLVLSWSANFLLGIWGTSSAVAYYSIAARMALLTSFVLIAVNSMVAPQFAALYKRGEHAALERLARNSTALVTLLATPLLLVFCFGARWLMSLFGPRFVEAAPLVVVLSIGQFVNVATGAVGYLLMMSGNERLMRTNHVVTALISVTLAVLLIPRYGAMGAAIATAVGLMLLNVISTVLAYRRLKILVIPVPRRLLGFRRG